MAESIQNKMRIIRALAVLLEEQPLDSVSVTEICKQAGISRQTFYRSFKDKYEIASWYTESITHATVHQVGRTLSWRDGYLALLQIEERNPMFFRSISSSRDYNSIFNLTIRLCERDNTEVYEMRTGQAPEGLLAYEIHAYSRYATECITEWIESNPPMQAEVFVDYLLALVPRELFNALEMESKPGRRESSMPLFI